MSRCLRCGGDVSRPGACCRSCQASDPGMCRALYRSWKLDRARREAHRLRVLHRGQTPWAAAGPPPPPAGYTPTEVALTSIEPGPARKVRVDA